MTNNTAFYGNIDIYNYEIYGTGGPSGAYSALLMNRTFDNIYGIPSFVNY